MAESKISPYSLNDLKNTTDDALGNYLRGLSFRQQHGKLDFRLAVGYTAVTIAAVTFVADYKLGWDATKGWTAAAVAAYAVLNAIFTYWMWAVERGLVFEGTRDGRQISIASKTKKYDPTYYLTITTTSPSSTRSHFQIKAPFTTWFTADGFFVAAPLQQWLASSVGVIGEVDAKNAGRGERKGVTAANDDAEDFDESGMASGAQDQSSKGSRRSRKKG